MSLSNHVLEASDGFINITNYSKDDLAKLSIGDFVKFSGTFYFNTVTNIDISCGKPVKLGMFCQFCGTRN